MYDPIQVLPLLKGCPISIINALTMARRLGLGPVSGIWLSAATGYSDKPVIRALAILEANDLVERCIPFGWVLAKQAGELVALAVPFPEEIGAESPNASTGYASIPDASIPDANIPDAGTPCVDSSASVPADSVPEALTPAVSVPTSSAPASATPASSAPASSAPASSAPASSAPASSVPASSASAANHRAIWKNFEAENLRSAIRKFSVAENLRTSSSGYIDSRNLENLLLLPGAKNPEKLRTRLRFASGILSAPDSQVAAVLAALDQGGVREPARSRLAADPRVTPELVQYHLATSKSTGQAIYRIEKDWPVDPHWRPPDIEAVDTSEDPGPLSAEEAAAREAEAAAREAEEAAWDAAADAFREAVQSIAGSFSRVEFLTWVESLWLGPVEGDVYQVETGNKIGLAWLEQRRVAELLENALRSITGQGIAVRLVVG